MRSEKDVFSGGHTQGLKQALWALFPVRGWRSRQGGAGRGEQAGGRRRWGAHRGEKVGERRQWGARRGEHARGSRQGGAATANQGSGLESSLDSLDA